MGWLKKIIKSGTKDTVVGNLLDPAELFASDEGDGLTQASERSGRTLQMQPGSYGMSQPPQYGYGNQGQMGPFQYPSSVSGSGSGMLTPSANPQVGQLNRPGRGSGIGVPTIFPDSRPAGQTGGQNVAGAVPTPMSQNPLTTRVPNPDGRRQPGTLNYGGNPFASKAQALGLNDFMNQRNQAAALRG